MMKKIYYLTTLIIIVSNAALHGITDQERFLQANKLYEQGNFDEAIDLYNGINPKGCATWYNLGNAHYRIGKYAKALVCWERSRNNATHSQLLAVEKNMQRARENLSVIEVPEHTILNMVAMFLRTIPLIYLYMFTALLIVVLGLICNKVMSTLWCMCYKIIISIVLCVTMSVSIFVTSYYAYGQKVAYVMQDAMPIYAGPDARYHLVVHGKNGDKVIVLAEQNGWFKIKHNTIIGWVELNTIEII